MISGGNTFSIDSPIAVSRFQGFRVSRKNHSPAIHLRSLHFRGLALRLHSDHDLIGEDGVWKLVMARSYRELLVWQKAKSLAVNVFRATESFPQSQLYGLTSQLRRAAVSVASNIAEGQGRLITGEFRHFLGPARGSLLEMETQLAIALDLGFSESGNLRCWTSSPVISGVGPDRSPPELPAANEASLLMPLKP
jgi:four helix bundle protein